MSRLNFEIYLCWHANKVSIACDSSALPSKWPGAAFASTWGPQDFFDKYVWQSHFHLEKWFGQLSQLVHFSLLLTHDCANVQIVSGIDLCWCVLICVKTAKGFPNQSDLQVSKLALRFLSYWSWSEIPDLLYLIDMGHCFLQYKLCSWHQMICDCMFLSCVSRWLAVTCRRCFVSFWTTLSVKSMSSIVSFEVNWLQGSQVSKFQEEVCHSRHALLTFCRPLRH